MFANLAILDNKVLPAMLIHDIESNGSAVIHQAEITNHRRDA